MRISFFAAAVAALTSLTACGGPPPEPAAPPSGKGWRIVAEGSQEVTARIVKTGRTGRTMVMSSALLNDGEKAATMTEEDVTRQLPVGSNVATGTFRAAGAAEKP